MSTYTYTFPISGTAMGVLEGSAISNDPLQYDNDSQGARDACQALQSCRKRKASRGYSFTVTTTRAGAECIEEYCRTVGETFVGDNPEARVDGRALLAVAARIAKELEKS